MLKKQIIILLLPVLIIYSSIKAQQSTILITENSTYGKILTDGEGNSLYFFTKDAFGLSTCVDNCEAIWPVFFSDSLIIDQGLDADDFSTIIRADSSKQTTYKGWPLYYFINDNAPGDVNGENVNGVWFVAKPDYTIMLVNNQLTGHDGIEYNSNYEQGQENVQYFVDAYGNTLYTFTKDNYNDNNFTSADFGNNSVWPIFEEDLDAVPSIIDTSLFDTIDVFGHIQLTYNGWPLYFFGQDSMMRGNNKGVSFPAPGVWPVAQTNIEPAQTVGVENVSNSFLPTEYNLTQNYPNPFNPTTVIEFSIPEAGVTSIKIYNSIGELVEELVNKFLPAGAYNISWNAGNVPSGVYLYSMTSNNFKQIRKMILLK